jgi:hypothetical protein
MNLPGHVDPDMTLPGCDLDRSGLAGVIDALSRARHVLEMFRRTPPNGLTRICLDRLSNR